jgi:hypothetical protein
VEIVHLSSLGPRRSRVSSFEKAEVKLEHDQLELRSRIAWVSERLAAGAALTAQIRPTHQPALGLSAVMLPDLVAEARIARADLVGGYSRNSVGEGQRAQRLRSGRAADRAPRNSLEM